MVKVQTCTRVGAHVTCAVTQLLDLPGGHGGPQHAPPLETRGQSPAEDHRGGGGQLPRDAGPPADTEGASSVPSPLDPGETRGGLACKLCGATGCFTESNQS